MPPTSTLQSQYPLSSRKFWKKMIQNTVSWFAILIFAFIATIVVIDLSSPTGSSLLIWDSFGIAIVAMIFVMVLYGFYVSAYIRRYYYDATDSYITIKKGVFAPAEIHVQYSKIQDVYVDQDIIDRIMGLYDVHLATATVASGMEAHIDGVEKAAADGLKNFLLQKLQSGGSGTPPSPNFTPNAAPNMPSAPVTFGKEISSATYPIVGTWFVQQAIAWFFTSIIYSIVIDFLALDKELITSDSILPVALGVFVVVYIFHLVYAILWRSTYSFSFLPDYIVTKQGIIAKAENHLPYRSVQDVTVSQGIIDRMLGIATVRIENAAAAQVVGKSVVSSAVRIPGQPLMKANEISDAIKRVALTKNSSQTGL